MQGTDLNTGKPQASPRPWVSIANIVAAIAAVIGVAVSLFIYWSPGRAPALTIERLATVSYATPQDLTALGEIRLTIDGQEISDLQSISFEIRNVGSVPISSVLGSSPYNLPGPISLLLSGDPKTDAPGRVLNVIPDSTSSVLSVTHAEVANGALIDLKLSHLNQGERAGFNILLGGYDAPKITLAGNPLVGGETQLVARRSEEGTVTWWGRFKRNTIPAIIGWGLLGTVAFLFGWLIIGAYQLRREHAYDEWRDSYSEQMAAGVIEQDNLVEAEFDALLEDFPLGLQETMTATNVMVPMSTYEATPVPKDVNSIFRDAFKLAWEWQVRSKYPIEDPPGKPDYALTDWYGWGDYARSAVFPTFLACVLLIPLAVVLLFVG